MSEFEYVTAAIAMIFSFSLARLMSNLAPVFTSSGRDAVHIAWVVLLLVNHLMVFFGSGTNAVVTTWTFLNVCLALLVPLSLLVAASILVPNVAASDYREHFESIRLPYYLVSGVTAILTQLTVIGLRGAADPGQMIVTFTLGALFFVGAYLRARRFDAALVLVTALAFAIYLIEIWDQELFAPISIG